MSEIDLSLGVAVGSAPAVASGVNPNLLTWTEEFNNAAWTKTAVTIDVDAITDPNAGSTAERANYDVESSLSQVTTTAATTGAAVATNKNVTTDWTRFNTEGTFDSLPYTLSVYLKSTAGVVLTMRLFRSGGFLVAAFDNLDDTEGRTIHIWGAKLEQGSLTDYVHRTT